MLSNFDIKGGTVLGGDVRGGAKTGWMDLPAEETEALVYSLQKYLREEFDEETSELKAKLMLNYIWEEIAPLAYNAGVKDAQDFMRARSEELPDTVFRDGLGYWRSN